MVISKTHNKIYNFTKPNNLPMKILKYLFLFALLSLVALTVFVATQKGIFDVERSKVINSPRATVYNYLNDFRNYEDFESWSVEDPSIQMTFPNKTSGSGASFYWDGVEGKGNAIILKTKDGESIEQKMKYEGTEADVSWTLKDTLNGKTKVTWKGKGTMSFLFKIYTALHGGSDRVIGTIYEKSLANIDKNLDYETKTYAVKVDGLVKKTETPYIKQTFTSEIEKVNKNARIVIPKLIHFSETNGLSASGKPFIIYHTYDTKTGLAKTTAFINKEKITPELSWSHLEIWTLSKLDVKGSSKLVTEIYFPVKPKVEEPVVPTPVYSPETQAEPAQKKPAATPAPAATTPAKEEEQSEF